VIFPDLILDASRSLTRHLQRSSTRLRTFVDAQLLISAQTTSAHVNALYAAAALDLPRRGVVELQGGMGTIAETLAHAVISNGGKVLYRHLVSRVDQDSNGGYRVETKRKGSFEADLLIFNLPPWNITSLMGESIPSKLHALPSTPNDGWGAYMLYVGLDRRAVDPEFPLHHQIVAGGAFGEGNTIFLSLSPSWDQNRAPEGYRALTISTHTNFRPWWQLLNQDQETYQSRQQFYTDKLLTVAESVIPQIRDAAQLILPGTPITFNRFTHREWGWVGGFPQTHLFRAWGPRLSKDLWMVGDSIFPGQSTPAVALGGLRVAKTILKELGSQEEVPARQPYLQAG
jgi:phytoene dehydrogenase-like protein